MAKRYYSDPLAAAWMYTHHDIRFENHFEITWRPEKTSEKKEDCCLILGPTSCLSWGSDKIYIHPDSEHLLEPQAGDVLLWKNGLGISVRHITGCKTSYFTKSALASFKRWPGKIIQRNGKAFHWPEEEGETSLQS